MSTLFVLLFLVCIISTIVCFVIFLIKLIGKKKTKAGIFSLLSLIGALVFFVLSGITLSNEKPSESKESTEKYIENNSQAASEDDSSEIMIETKESESAESLAENEDISDDKELLKTELKEKYDVSEPRDFIKGDSAGWKIVNLANGTAPYKYALQYAQAYMSDGDIHFIVNFTLKTTTKLHVAFGKLNVVTTEYVDNEEHDARIIGDGLFLGEENYDLETGKQITTEGDISAGTVDSDELIKAVSKAIEGQVGENEKITDVTFDGSDLKISVDMSQAENKKISVEILAESRISSITQAILDLDDKYYNTWESITLDFSNIGKATFYKREVKDQGLGRYFEVPVGIFENDTL